MIKKLDFRKVVGLATACMTMLTFAAAAQAKAAPAMVKGEVLDMSCYLASGMHGPSHKECAQTCINKGAAVGLLTSSGKVYLLVEDHDKPAAYASAKTHAGDQIEVTGTLADKGGIQGIVVDDVK